MNQPTPELLPVPQEVEQQALLTEIRNVIIQAYWGFVLSHTWMLGTGLVDPQNIVNMADCIMYNLELDISEIEELQQFIQDLRANPRQLDSEFLRYWVR